MGRCTPKPLGCIILVTLTACQAIGRPAATIDSVAIAALSTLDQPTTHDAVLGLGERDGFLVRSAIDFSTTSLRQVAWRAGVWIDQGPPWPDLDGAIAGGSRAPDGRRLVGWTTAESRLGGAWDLWISTPTGPGWSHPRPLASLNSAAMECCLVASEPGWLYFASNRGGSWDVFRAPMVGDSVGDPERLGGSVNTPHDEWPSFADPAGRFLLHSSIRPGGRGADDIYRSCRRGDEWEVGQLLDDEVNSPRFEDSAILSPDGRWLVYARHGGPGGSPGAIRIASTASWPPC
ncbi:MAG: hypothetical protein SFV24_08780 [Gemmatimonadales bacterium]|nr:hypothetical protein [Gemmatimonadales bacterium]